MSANSDRAIELWDLTVNKFAGHNYADAKLKRNDRVVSIGAATDSVEVRGSEVDIEYRSNVSIPSCDMRYQQTSSYERHTHI